MPSLIDITQGPRFGYLSMGFVPTSKTYWTYHLILTHWCLQRKIPYQAAWEFLVDIFRPRHRWANIWRRNVNQNITNNYPSNILHSHSSSSCYCQKHHRPRWHFLEEILIMNELVALMFSKSAFYKYLIHKFLGKEWSESMINSLTVSLVSINSSFIIFWEKCRLNLWYSGK